jgi:hypothetical protein
MRALLLVLMLAACGQPKLARPTPEVAAEPQQDAVPGGDGERQAYAFRGTITELRQLEPAREGMPLVLEDVIVLSTSNKDNRYYVADAMGGEYGGIEVQGCDTCDDRVTPGTTVDVEGLLSVEDDERYLVKTAALRTKSRAHAEVPVASLPAPLAAPDEANNGRFIGGYVVLVDADSGSPSRFSVVDVTPEGASEADACYRYFVVEEQTTRARVHVSTAVWQCHGIFVVGDVIARLAGVLDVIDHEVMIVPVSDKDVELAR